MKKFNIGDTVYFNFDTTIHTGVIERNNGVSKGTYNVSYSVEGIDYVIIMESKLLFKNKGDVVVNIITSIDSTIKWKMENIARYKKDIISAEEEIKAKEEIKKKLLAD